MARKKEENVIENVLSGEDIKEEKINENEKSKGIRLSFPIVIVILLVVCIAAFLIFRKVKSSMNGTNANATKVETVANTNELKDKLNIDMKDPENASGIEYGVEGTDVARMTYTKTFESGASMTFTLRSSSSLESIALELNEEWGASIMMTTYCDDGSDIQVLSNVSINNNQIMKAEWYDNDLYWTMTSDDLTTREDFLQEVNRVIIANHIEF